MLYIIKPKHGFKLGFFMKKVLCILFFIINILTIHANDLLIVTHLYDGWNGSNIIKEKIEKKIERNENVKILYNDSGHIYSEKKYKRVTIVGLYFQACLSNTVYSMRNKVEEKIILPMDCILVNRERTLKDHFEQTWNENKQKFKKDYLSHYFNRVLKGKKYNIYISKNYNLEIIFNN